MWAAVLRVLEALVSWVTRWFSPEAIQARRVESLDRQLQEFLHERDRLLATVEPSPADRLRLGVVLDELRRLRAARARAAEGH